MKVITQNLSDALKLNLKKNLKHENTSYGLESDIRARNIIDKNQ